MEPGHHTDPLEEALSHGSQRVAQLASLAGAMAQVVIQRQGAARRQERPPATTNAPPGSSTSKNG